MTAGSIFRSEFLDKGLCDFQECQDFYENLSFDELVKELRFLLSPEIASVPFAFSGQRYYALCVVIIDKTANSRQFNDKRRGEAVGNVVIPLIDYNRQRTGAESLEMFENALNASVNFVEKYGLYPKVAELIRNRIEDYSGEFTPNVVAEILEK